MASVVIATELPSLSSLRSSVYNVLLLDYMMTCYRVPASYYLPVPPPEIKQSETKTTILLKYLSDAYMRMLVMLADDFSTEREKLLVTSHAALVHLQKWLPPYKPEDVVRCEKPANMDHKDWVYMFKECNGQQSYISDHCMFFSREDMQKFLQYMQAKL